MEWILILTALAVLVILCAAILLRQKRETNDDAALRTELINQFQLLSGMVLDTVDKASAANGRNIGLLRQTVEEKLAEIRISVDQKLDTTLRSGLPLRVSANSFSRSTKAWERCVRSPMGWAI